MFLFLVTNIFFCC